MRTIIAGSRDFNNYELLKEEVEKFERDNSPSYLTVVCGEARGADSLGKNWALENEKVVIKFPADWEKHGKSAGYIRNVEMAEYSDALIAFWDGKSRGTKNMIDIAINQGLLVKVIKYEE